MFRVIPKGIAEVRAQLADIDATQVPFAMAKALTKTAQAAQSDVRQGQPSRFTLRRASWIRGNVRIQPATKKTLEAQVFDTFDAMGLQEEGGVKVPTHKQWLCVPLKGARPTVRSLIRPEDMPDEVMKAGGFIRNQVMYKVAFKAGRRGRVAGKFGISTAANWQRKIIPMYYLTKTWAVKKRYGFQETVVATVNKNFETNFRDAFNQAVNTKK